MFTGIVERTGEIVSLSQNSNSMTKLWVNVESDFDTDLGDSVAINGCCLTVTEINGNYRSFDISSETLAKTTLGQLQEKSLVNLERALRLGDRLGGHLVTGHVDDRGLVVSLIKETQGWLLKVKVNPRIGRYCIPKGSICLDGISLTVNAVEDNSEETLVSVCLIPTTIQITTFKRLNLGQELNVELDCIGKYMERLAKFHLT